MNMYRVALNMPFLYEIEANDRLEAIEKGKAMVQDELGISNVMIFVDYVNTYEMKKDENTEDSS